jgi:hypothetical protein
MPYVFYALTKEFAVKISEGNNRDHVISVGERVVKETGIDELSYGYIDGASSDLKLAVPTLSLVEGILRAKQLSVRS